MAWGRESLLTHVLLIREKHHSLFPSIPPTDYHLIWSALVVRKAGAGSGSFIFSGRRPGRKKVVQESFRETNSCVCFITGSKYLVCVPPLSLACPWPVTNISYRSTIKPKCNLGIVLSTRLQAVASL